MPDEDLAWFTLPTPIDTRTDTWDTQRIDDNRREDPNASFHYAQRGATTRVQGTFAGMEHEWDGRVVRTEGG